MATPSLSTAQEILTRNSLWSSLLPFRLRLFTSNVQKRVPHNQKLMIHKFLRDGYDGRRLSHSSDWYPLKCVVRFELKITAEYKHKLHTVTVLFST